MTAPCEIAIRSLLEGRFLEWRGLPADCSPATLDRIFGGSTVLDARAILGDGRARCTRSSMNEAPIVAWHSGDGLVLVEVDLLSAPFPAPDLGGETVERLDVEWGFTTLVGGERVLAARGLALVVTGSERVVSCLGFAPTSLESYVAELRPRRYRPVPLPAPDSERGGS